MIASSDARSRKTKLANGGTIKPGTNTSFGSLKQIDAGLLRVGYAEAGPTDGPAVILLHGWPYDIHSYVDVAPLLASSGYRVIIPYLRGYGTTRFLSSETFRNGQPSAVALDTIDLMDALKLEKATLAGFHWGARTANIIAALWPERCKAMVSVSGYLIGSQESGKLPLPPKAELEWWYQYYFATERGRAGYERAACSRGFRLRQAQYVVSDDGGVRTALPAEHLPPQCSLRSHFQDAVVWTIANGEMAGPGGWQARPPAVPTAACEIRPSHA